MSFAALIMKIICDKDMVLDDVNHDEDAEAQPNPSELNDATNGI
jgi:hypothetical protein